MSDVMDAAGAQQQPDADPGIEAFEKEWNRLAARGIEARGPLTAEERDVIESLTTLSAEKRDRWLQGLRQRRRNLTPEAERQAVVTVARRFARELFKASRGRSISSGAIRRAEQRLIAAAICYPC